MISHISFGLVVGNRGYPKTDRQTFGVESEVNESIPQRWNDGVTYLVYQVNECLNVSPLETSNNVGCLHVRDDRLDDGDKFVLGDSMANQALQSSFIRVESGRWFREVVRVP